MPNPSTAQTTGQTTRGKQPRVVYYIALGVLMLVALIAARIMGMPKGVGIEHEPEESSPARQTENSAPN